MSVPARFGEALPHGRVRCRLCPRHCTMRDGQRGFCYVRANQGGRLVLTTFGRSSGFAIDPVEKKPLNHFLPGARVLSFGTAGCNLGCRFCQNWEISTARSEDRLAATASPDAIAAAAIRRGANAVAYTYNDPIIFAEYAMATAHACHEAGVRNIAVTAGYISEEARAPFFADMDAANVDLKSFSDEFYRSVTGARLDVVLSTIAWLVHCTDVWVELTTLLIPGHNDSDDELEELTAWVADELGTDVPLHFSAFHPSHRMLDTPATEPSTLLRARKIARGHGLRYVYTGNIADRGSQSTYCPGCGEVVIARDVYRSSVVGLKDGCCAFCGTRIAGVFR